MPQLRHNGCVSVSMGAWGCALTLLSPCRSCPLLQDPGAPIQALSDSPPYSEVGGDARITTSREMHFKSRIWKESCLTWVIGIEMAGLPLFQKAQTLNSWRNLKHIIFDTSIAQMRNLNLKICFFPPQNHDGNPELAFLTSGGCSPHFPPRSPFL